MIVEPGGTMSWHDEDGLLYVIHRTDDLEQTRPEDWDAFVTYVFERPRLDAMMVLAIANKLDANQRSDVRRIHAKYGTKMAVITKTAVVRGVLTALSWFGIPIKGFDVDQLEAAHEFIGRPGDTARGTELLMPYIRAHEQRNKR